MAYLGLCDTYGPTKIITAGFIIPPVVAASIEFAKSAQPELIQAAAGIALISTFAGYSGARVMHDIMNTALDGKSIGPSRGSKITQASQLSAYALCFTLATHFGGNSNEEPPINQDTLVLDSSPSNEPAQRPMLSHHPSLR